MSIRLVILILTITVNSFLALLVYKNKPNSATNRIFGYLSLVTTIWLIDVYISVSPTYIQHSLLWGRLSVFFAAPQIMLFFLFAHTLPRERIQLKKRRLCLLIIATVAVMADALSPFAFTKVTISGDKVLAFPGPGLPLFVLFAIGLSAASIYVLIKKLRRTLGYEKEQYKYVVTGLILMLGLLSLTVLIPVAIFKSNRFVALAPLYTIAFLGFTTYAIVKKRLFDVRLVVARSMAYLLSLGVITGVFSIFLFGFSGVVLTSHYPKEVQQIFYGAITVGLVFSYPPLKKFFDRLTRNLFYRDAYDPQATLDELGGVLAAEIDLSKVLNSTRSILTNAIKSSFIEFILVEDNKPHLESSSNKTLQTEANELSILLKNQRKDIIVTEELGVNNPFKEVLTRDSVAVSLQLKTQHQIVGYVLFGDKMSGSVYSAQDTKLLTIVANELAITVQNALRFVEIQRFNVTLQEKVDEATKQLRHANQRLKELDQTKDEFISMASHQLRTPLTTIKGYLSMVLEGDVGPVSKNEKQMIQQAFDSAERMVFLIADLLNVSRLQSGKFIIDDKPTDLVKMVDAQVSQLKETAVNHHLTLTFKKPEKFPILNLDETKIQQVVMNFMDNAIYYTPAGGSIEVALEASDKEIAYTVTDTGLGVPKSEQHHLFAKFYRAENARKMRPDGTGLGLFMAKKVIVAQGGAIIFKSTEGKGSTFGFSFPRSKVEATK